MNRVRVECLQVVRMWFADNSGVGGSFYSGTVVSQSLPENGDPWDSVTVRWEDGEEMQVISIAFEFSHHGQQSTCYGVCLISDSTPDEVGL